MGGKATRSVAWGLLSHDSAGRAAAGMLASGTRVGPGSVAASQVGCDQSIAVVRGAFVVGIREGGRGRLRGWFNIEGPEVVGAVSSIAARPTGGVCEPDRFPEVIGGDVVSYPSLEREEAACSCVVVDLIDDGGRVLEKSCIVLGAELMDLDGVGVGSRPVSLSSIVEYGISGKFAVFSGR